MPVNPESAVRRVAQRRAAAQTRCMQRRASGVVLIASLGLAGLIAAAPVRAQMHEVEAATDQPGGRGVEVAEADLPDAPAPQAMFSPGLRPTGLQACSPGGFRAALDSSSAALQQQQTPQASPSFSRPEQRETRPGFPPVSPQPTSRPSYAPRQNVGVPTAPPQCVLNTCVNTVSKTSCAPVQNPFQSFLDSTYPHPLTPRQKAMLALRNSIDPFNFATIGFLSAVSVASSPHSPYGPGFPGLGRNVAVSYTETVVGEFFGTFLIPAAAHEDPHYHRLPNASFQRRFLHAITQVAWTESDYGDYMVNYSILLGTPITDTIGNGYIPGRQETLRAGMARWATAIATDPIDNFVTEFLPDIASHINLRIVLLQRVINEVAVENGGGGVQ